MIKQNPEHNPYYQSDIRDAIRTRKWLAGHDMSDEPKWIVEEKNISRRMVCNIRFSPTERNQMPSAPRHPEQI